MQARTKLSAEEQAQPPISLDLQDKADGSGQDLAEELHESELADEDEVGQLWYWDAQ